MVTKPGSAPASEGTGVSSFLRCRFSASLALGARRDRLKARRFRADSTRSLRCRHFLMHFAGSQSLGPTTHEVEAWIGVASPWTRRQDAELIAAYHGPDAPGLTSCSARQP